jgi:intracellular sulfur oxidation DsrE/DsrF family protein
MNETLSTFKRRWFLSRAGAGLAGIGAVVGGRTVVEAQTAGGAATFEPARHEEDAWFDQVPGVHRFFLDTVSANGFGEGLFFANNFYTANRSGYKLADKDLAVVICARHASTPFAYNQAMWTKYGAILSELAEFTDPKTKQAVTVNVYQASGYGDALRNRNVTIDSLVARGTHFAVCAMATRMFASMVARRTNQQADAVFTEITSNLVGNAQMVPAGIVAVNRAQEHGYTFAYVG